NPADDPDIVAGRTDYVHSLWWLTCPIGAMHEQSLCRATCRSSTGIGPRIRPGIQESQYPIALPHCRHIDDQWALRQIQPGVRKQSVIIWGDDLGILRTAQAPGMCELINPAHAGSGVVPRIALPHML